MGHSELLLHPVRLRIVQAFLGRGELTTAQLGQELADVPSATLYRQIATLLEGGVLEVVAEHRVRGAVERTLVLREAHASVDADEASRMAPDEHRRSFQTFVAGLLGEFDRYLDSGDVDLGRDLVGYRQYAAHLTDQEMLEFVDELRAVVEPRLANQPAPGRRRRLFTTIVLPSD
jgi:hypothetical protein